MSMSEGPELSETEALAAEHALGVLSAAQRAEAELRMARDPAFAVEVEAWRARLAPMSEEGAAVPPPPGGWARIARLLPANEDGAVTGAVRFWRRSTLGAFALAAASLAVVAMQAGRPPTVIQAPAQGELLNASLMSQGDGVQPLFVAAYDPARRALIITSLMPAGTDVAHVHELWLIHGQDKPKPLGFVEPGKSKMIAMPDGMTGKMAEGSALAISIEAPGGSTNPDGPTGPIAAMGKLARL